MTSEISSSAKSQSHCSLSPFRKSSYSFILLTSSTWAEFQATRSPILFLHTNFIICNSLKCSAPVMPAFSLLSPLQQKRVIHREQMKPDMARSQVPQSTRLGNGYHYPEKCCHRLAVWMGSLRVQVICSPAAIKWCHYSHWPVSESLTFHTRPCHKIPSEIFQKALDR